MKSKLIVLLFVPFIALADKVTIDMNAYSANQPKKIGQVVVEDSSFGGVLIQPQLTGLPTGVHGFHIHTMPSCEPMMHDGKMEVAGAAGSHLDPKDTKKHEGPYGTGHLGDLPVLVVNADGTANLPTLAPRLKVSDFKGHSLMIHQGGDNYSDTPKPNGGGGDRIGCGVIAQP